MKTDLKSNFGFKLTTFIFSIVFFLSCDPAIGYKYTVNNKSDKVLKVYYKSTYSDSLLVIKPKTKTVFFDDEIIGSNPHDEKDGFLLIFDSLKIDANDNSIITLDYLKRENWAYSCEPSQIFIKAGLNKYEIEINNENFK